MTRTVGIFACATALLGGCYDSYFAVPDGDREAFLPADDGRSDTRERGGDADADADTGDADGWEPGDPCPPGVVTGAPCSAEPYCDLPDLVCTSCGTGAYVLTNETCYCASVGLWRCEPPDVDCFGPGDYCDSECTLPPGSCDGDADADADADGDADADSCVPDCEGRACGSDGCGGTCPPLFYDDFTSDPHDRWVDVSGTWVWDGVSTFASTDGTAGANTWIGPRTWTDYVLEVRMRPDCPGGNDAGVMSRTQTVSPVNDGGNHFYLGLYPGSDQVIMSYMNGSWNPFGYASASVPADVWHTVQVRHHGSDYEIWVDAARLLSGRDGTYASGSVGLRTFLCPATYDYVQVCN